MSHIKLSDRARNDIKRLYDFLAQFDLSVADNGNTAIIEALENIESNPLNGSPVEDRPNVRKVVVDFGASGYLIFHKRYERTDTNLVSRIIHQKEWYESGSMGLSEETTEEKLSSSNKK